MSNEYTLSIASSDGSPVEVLEADVVDERGPGRVVATWRRRPAGLIHVSSARGGFSVWPDELVPARPVVVVRLGVAVTVGDDCPNYQSSLAALAQLNGQSALEAIRDEPETTFATAARRSRELKCPTWLGLGRDFRVFLCGFRGIGAGLGSERLWDWIAPQWHGQGAVRGDDGSSATRYHYMVGRGISSESRITRRLRAGYLPLVDVEIGDGPLSYDVTQWAALERSVLTKQANLGTPFLLADGHSRGHALTQAQANQFDVELAGYEPTEQTVLYTRVTVTNPLPSARHAFVMLPVPYAGENWEPVPHTFDVTHGFGLLSDGSVYMVATVDGRVASRLEMRKLLQPGEQMCVEFAVPHSPVDRERAADLRDRSSTDVENEVVAYWSERLATAAQIDVPEARIGEMFRAGLAHLELSSYGSEPGGPVAPCVGIYPPIGSESAPIMQLFDSVGWSSLAERCLDYFFAKQHSTGMMQNYRDIVLETEAVLWGLGEHYRYTRDSAWVRRILPKMDAAVQYIAGKRAAQIDSGIEPQGLLVGKTADPDDEYAAYMLNGFAILGLFRAAEMVDDVDPERAARWRALAQGLEVDVRTSLDDAVSKSPVVPLGNGSWSRTVPPWPGQPGPVALDRSPASWYTHGSVSVRDTLLGPLWLATQEVLSPGETLVSEMLDYHADVLFHENAAFSQPYYSTHGLTHLRRGETKEFLRSFYTMVAALADRETFSFWEHYFHASPHKTHEEAWFLMQVRWMLWLEDGDTLRLFSGVPRAWFNSGERISVTGARSYFGSLDFSADVAADGGSVALKVRVGGDGAHKIRKVAFRVPHPAGPSSAEASVGVLDETTETVTVPVYAGDTAELVLRWLPSHVHHGTHGS